MTTQEKQKNIQHTDWWVLFATISASSMAFIGGSALNVALPAIQRELGASGADLLWIVNSYALLLASLILVGGSLGDHYGRKRIYMIGIGIFAITSFICGIAPSTEILIISRIMQGIGGAMMIPGSLAIVSAYFDDSKRGWAIGIWSAFTMMTSMAGPVLGGVLAENGLWRFVFFINIPLGIVALRALIVYVPESYDEEASKELDFLGAILATLGLAGFTFGFIEGPQRGFDDPVILLSIIGGLIALLAFIWDEKRSDHPMMPLRLFKSKTFSGANILTLLLYGALGGVLFFLPLNLIQVQSYSESAAGFSLLPMMILMVGLSFVMGSVVDRYGSRIPLIIGPLLVSVAFVLLSTIGITSGQDAYWTTFFPAICVFGVGMGITVAPLTTSVMGSVPQHNAGIASGINNAMSRSSQVLAVAIMGGIALLLFNQALLSDPMILELPQNEQDTLAAESANLAGTSAPDTLSAESQDDVRQVIKEAFTETFSVIMLIAAGMSFASAIFAGLLVEKNLHTLEDKPADNLMMDTT
jgi:EmrB/QacA subfamily drug resistance transporter